MFRDPDVIKARRIQDAWSLGVDSVRELAIYPPIQRLLRVLYEREPIPFQTLNFEWGTQQPGHSDSLHFSCLPPRYMCGVWVALEDTTATNGPLFYYPGSHRLPEVNVYDLGKTVDDPNYRNYEEFQRELMGEMGIEAVELHARQGDVLIWSSNIVHGGRPVVDEGSTRRSQVTHYYFEGCAYYIPYLSEIPTGELYLKNVININTLAKQPHTYNGKPLSIAPLSDGRSRISIGGEDRPEPTLGNDPSVPEVDALRQALATTQAELAEIRGSETFRLGAALVRPAHYLRQLAGRLLQNRA